jgi:hypothetical protein
MKSNKRTFWRSNAKSIQAIQEEQQRRAEDCSLKIENLLLSSACELRSRAVLSNGMVQINVSVVAKYPLWKPWLLVSPRRERALKTGATLKAILQEMNCIIQTVMIIDGGRNFTQTQILANPVRHDGT